jgi:regulatory protein
MSLGQSSLTPHRPTLKAALALLKYRLRSEQELRERLQLKKFADRHISQTMRYLKKIKLLDDRQFAKEWTSSRLHKHYSIHLIKIELKHKGINSKIINDLCPCPDQRTTEQESIKQLMAKKKSYYRHLDPITRRRRLYGYLARKGFHNEDILTVLNLC